MFNYKNLCDYEFEILCKDIMQKKLGVPFQIFARGRDGGIDITDDTVSKNVVIQVKHYINSNGSYHEVDVDKVVNILADCVRNDIYDDVTDKLAVFPRAITDDIDLSRYDIWADAGEIESYVCDVLADPGDRDYGDFYDEDRSYSGYLDGMDELDFIFAE